MNESNLITFKHSKFFLTQVLYNVFTVDVSFILNIEVFFMTFVVSDFCKSSGLHFINQLFTGLSL